MNTSASFLRKAVCFALCVVVGGGCLSCSKRFAGTSQAEAAPLPGTYKGDVVSLEVSADRQMITDLRLTMGATGGMTVMHMPNAEIKIENNDFRFDRARDRMVAIPEVHVMGHFTSNKEAAGWVNGTQWTAHWVAKDTPGGK